VRGLREKPERHARVTDIGEMRDVVEEMLA
jgi:hypothetical protein